MKMNLLARSRWLVAFAGLLPALFAQSTPPPARPSASDDTVQLSAFEVKA